MTSARVHLLPPSADLCDRAAQHLVAQYVAQLPDLSRVTVLLPFHSAALPLRRALAAHAGRGLLGPQIFTLDGFIQTRAANITALPALDCRLRLASALARHRHLFPGVGNAQAADALFSLFEELITHGLDLGSDERAFTTRLQTAYGAQRSLHFLSNEAQIAHRLFTAYLQETQNQSPAAARRRQLQAAFATDQPLILIGFDAFSPAETAAVKQALAQGHAELWLQGRRDGRDGDALNALCQNLGIAPQVADEPATSTSALLDATFAASNEPVTVTLEQPLPTAMDGGSAARGRKPESSFEIVQASGPEHEARCVDVAVRQALLDGAKTVTVISGDRRLARRLRALLDRAGVPLHDPAGWALSTSSAAACLNAWLECLASDFQFRPLLTLLKSSFVGTDAESLRALERDLIYGKSVESDLEVFLRESQPVPYLTVVLERLRQSAKRMPDWNGTQSGEAWCRSLRQAFDTLAISERLQHDAAGAALLTLLDELGRALTQHRLMLDGDGFRELLDRQLERETFVPDRRASPVQLLTLDQSHNLRSDLLIIAGATAEQLPGSPTAEPLFNAEVRRELGLPRWSQRQSLSLSRLRRLLESAPRVLITYAAESPGEEAVLSPWIEALEATARAGGHALRNAQLPLLAAGETAEIALADTVPPGKTPRPAPATPADRLPATISASAHQALVDCPYQFFARSLLGLRSPQAPDQDPDRSEYGKRVHRILQMFTEPVTAATRESAHAQLKEIARQVFAPDLRAHARAQLWVAEFHSQLPALLDWLCQRAPFAEVRTEIELETALGARTLNGRADRLEVRADGSQVLVDYKTGRVPKDKDVRAGEAVQLLHYAALDARIVSAEYLALSANQSSVAMDETLNELRNGALKRLSATLTALDRGAVLPAHGDDAACEHCDYQGLCRKGDWEHG